MSLSLQNTGSSWLSPGDGAPAGDPRRTSARRKNATVAVLVSLVIVTLVAVSAPSGPGCGCVVALTPSCAGPSVRSSRRSAYWLIVAPALPIVLDQSTMSGWVESQ